MLFGTSNNDFQPISVFTELHLGNFICIDGKIGSSFVFFEGRSIQAVNHSYKDYFSLSPVIGLTCAALNV
jgi:hypothetical protein